VKRVTAFLDQVDDPIKPPGTTGNLQRRAWCQTVADDPSDVCKKEIGEIAIIRNVEKRSAPIDAPISGHLLSKDGYQCVAFSSLKGGGLVGHRLAGFRLMDVPALPKRATTLSRPSIRA
jgi:hypothetical protein